MPLMVEPLVMQVNAVSGGYMVDGDLDKILPLVRQAVELGANVIKADPCDDVKQYHQVIEVASGRPVLVRGGGKASEEEIVTRTYELLLQGAAGMFFGLHGHQHAGPPPTVPPRMRLIPTYPPPPPSLSLLHSY